MKLNNRYIIFVLCDFPTITQRLYGQPGGFLKLVYPNVFFDSVQHRKNRSRSSQQCETPFAILEILFFFFKVGSPGILHRKTAGIVRKVINNRQYAGRGFNKSVSLWIPPHSGRKRAYIRTRKVEGKKKALQFYDSATQDVTSLPTACSLLPTIFVVTTTIRKFIYFFFLDVRIYYL